MPDFTGLSLWQANQLAVNRGLNLRVSGSAYGNSDVMAYKQDIAPGEKTELGAFVTIWFRNTDEAID